MSAHCTTPQIKHGLLEVRFTEGDEKFINHHHNFQRIEDKFTRPKEKRTNEKYWCACRKTDGKLKNKCLATSQELTHKKLYDT